MGQVGRFWLGLSFVCGVACGGSDGSTPPPEGSENSEGGETAITSGTWGGGVADPSDSDAIERLATFSIEVSDDGQITGEYRDDQGNEGVVTGTANGNSLDLEVSGVDEPISITGTIQEDGSFSATFEAGDGFSSDLNGFKTSTNTQLGSNLGPVCWTMQFTAQDPELCKMSIIPQCGDMEGDTPVVVEFETSDGRQEVADRFDHEWTEAGEATITITATDSAGNVSGPWSFTNTLTEDDVSYCQGTSGGGGCDALQECCDRMTDPLDIENCEDTLQKWLETDFAASACTSARETYESNSEC